MTDRQHHLWEVEHDYYCVESNFFGNGHGRYPTIFHFDSWDEFLADRGDSIDRYNLLFRWDWHDSADPDHEDETADGMDRLWLYFFLQRKGYHQSCRIRVRKEDEQRVKEYLAPKLAYLMALWAPISKRNGVPTAASEQADEI